MKTPIRKILLALFLLAAFSAHSQQYWLGMNSPVTLDLKKGFFLDSITGYVCGDSGLIMKTTNGGLTWAKQNTKVKDPVHEVFFLNKRLGWALSWNILNPNPPFGTMMLRTTDGGINWDTAFYPYENVYLKTVFFQDSSYGFMGGIYKNILRTTDGGAHWLAPYIDTTLTAWLPVSHFDFYSTNFGYATGGQTDFAGVVWRTTDRGVSWYPSLVSAEPTMNVCFLDSMRIICMNGDQDYGPSLVTTSNSGANWKYDYLGYFGPPTQMAYRTRNEAWTPLGFGRKFIFSLDSGYSWRQFATPDSSEMNCVVFPDSLHGYAFGNLGKMLKYNRAVIGIGNISNEVSGGFTLGQNYPNPFNPRTNIIYELKTPGYVVLKIFDINGREIRTLVNGFHNAGKYKLGFSGENLSSGIYFYEIFIRGMYEKSNGDYRETKKMLLIK